VRAKSLQVCWDGRLRGRHTNPCPDPGDGKATRKILKARGKLATTICRACGGTDAICGGARDFTPGEIGFVPACPSVTVPSGGPSCARPIVVLDDVVACLACVNEYQVHCRDPGRVPPFAADPLGTLSRIRQTGYDAVEFAAPLPVVVCTTTSNGKSIEYD